MTAVLSLRTAHRCLRGLPNYGLQTAPCLRGLLRPLLLRHCFSHARFSSLLRLRLLLEFGGLLRAAVLRDPRHQRTRRLRLGHHLRNVQRGLPATGCQLPVHPAPQQPLHRGGAAAVSRCHQRRTSANTSLVEVSPGLSERLHAPDLVFIRRIEQRRDPVPVSGVRVRAVPQAAPQCLLVAFFRRTNLRFVELLLLLRRKLSPWIRL